MASNITVDTLTKGGVTLNTDEIVDTNSTQVCKAWVNFNGTGTVAIRGSYNVSSITDNGTGQHVINLTTAMADTNYCPINSDGGNVQSFQTRCKVLTASTIELITYDSSYYDSTQLNVAVFSS